METSAPGVHNLLRRPNPNPVTDATITDGRALPDCQGGVRGVGERNGPEGRPPWNGVIVAADRVDVGLFGDLLRRERLACGLTQEELAGRAGLSIRAISDLERGRTTRPHPRSVRLLADALGMAPAATDRLVRAARRGRDAAPQQGMAGAPAGKAIQAGDQELAAAVVAQLPADVADFVGRKDLAEELCRRLGAAARSRFPGAVVVLVVAGPGGIGKTSLAVHVAHRMASRFPDGHLYAPLQGASAQPLAPAEVLGRFLRSLGVAGSAIPAGEQERAAAFRSMLAGRRVLIVLDDARDAAQVRPLLPGRASCAVLVTSRNWLADLDGAVAAELEVLSPAEAHALFSRIVGQRRAAAEPDDVQAVLEACAGLPLAIRLAAVRLACRPGWRVHDLALRLADERKRLNELAVGDRAVRACFQVSYAALPPSPGPGEIDAGRAFRLLGIWPGKDVSLPAAAAMLDRPCEHTEQELELLVDAHLLESPVQGRYGFHDLLRVFAAERAAEQESSQAQSDARRRLLTWYVQAMAAAARVLVPKRAVPPLDGSAPAGELPAFETYRQVMGWCEDELPNLVTATTDAARYGMHDIAWKLPATAWVFFELRNHWPEWIITHQIALGSARSLGDRYGEAWVLNNLGVAYGQQLQSAKALDYLQQSLTLRRQLGDWYGQARTLNNIGVVLDGLKSYQEAIASYEQALAIYTQIGDRHGEAMALENLGEAYARTRALDRAVEHLQDALILRRSLGDRYGEGSTLDGLAESFTYIGEFAEAIECCEQSLKIRVEIGDRYGVAESLDRMAHALAQSGQPDQARESWEQAAALYTKLGHPHASKVQASLDQLSGDHHEAARSR